MAFADRALDLFPKLYFFVPPAGRRTVRKQGYALVISDPIRQLIVAKASASAIRATAVREGLRGLREDGCVKIREGLTTMMEVLRVVVGTDA